VILPFTDERVKVVLAITLGSAGFRLVGILLGEALGMQGDS